MFRRQTGSRALSALVVAAVLAAPAIPTAARAQDGFLLGTPDGSLAIRAGYGRARAGSDIFTDPSTTGALSLSKGDFTHAQTPKLLRTRASRQRPAVSPAQAPASMAPLPSVSPNAAQREAMNDPKQVATTFADLVQQEGVYSSLYRQQMEIAQHDVVEPIAPSETREVVPDSSLHESLKRIS